MSIRRREDGKFVRACEKCGAEMVFAKFYNAEKKALCDVCFHADVAEAKKDLISVARHVTPGAPYAKVVQRGGKLFLRF